MDRTSIIVLEVYIKDKARLSFRMAQRRHQISLILDLMPRTLKLHGNAMANQFHKNQDQSGYIFFFHH